MIFMRVAINAHHMD